VRQEQAGRLDILVNALSGDWCLAGAQGRFWKLDLGGGLQMQQHGVHAHAITSHYAVPLMVARRQGLIVEITDGNTLSYRHGTNLYYDLAKVSAIRLAYAMSIELKRYNIAVVALTPGYMRSEAMLERHGVTEENWQGQIAEDRPGSLGFADSETPCYVGRAVAALAADPQVIERTGRALSAGWLAREYGFTDVDGRLPPGYHQREGAREGGFTGHGFEVCRKGQSDRER
jgi:NAD(P)-dependent dehydrogenase (short-subunit alcohol dehydrogenase family)